MLAGFVGTISVVGVAIPILDYLDREESVGLAEFLVEMVALEEAVDRLLMAFYSAPGRSEDFYRQFLRTSMLGTKVDRLKPVTRTLGVGDDLIRDVRVVVAIRNAVAHRLPRTTFSEWSTVTDDDDIELYREYRTEERVIDARSLADWAAAVAKIRDGVSVLSGHLAAKVAMGPATGTEPQ